MTIGSFVCTACSGLLRGLNPPHRVKSISMASFSVEEMEFIKNRGNDFCRKVWLGTFDSRMAPEIDTKDENRMREMMSLRYDRKRWYVQPTDAMYEEARHQNETSSTAKLPPTGTAKPLTLLVGSTVPPLNVQHEKSPISTSVPAMQTQSIQRPSHANNVPSIVNSAGIQSVGLSSPRSPPATLLSQQPQQQQASVDLLADFGTDAFSSQQKSLSVPQQQQAADGFANFTSFSGHRPGVVQTSLQAPPPSQSVLLPSNASAQHGSQPTSVPSSSTQQSTSAADKYSALAELESVFSTTSIGSGFGPSMGHSVNWGGGSGGVGGGTSTMWGQPGAAPPSGVLGGAGAGGASSFGGGGTGVVSPLGMSPPSYSSVAAMAAANPFGQPAVAGGLPYMAVSVPGGYGAMPPFGPPAGATGAAYSYFGAPAPATGYGMFATGPSPYPAQNGGSVSVGSGTVGYPVAAQGSTGMGAGVGGGMFGGGAGQVPLGGAGVGGGSLFMGSPSPTQQVPSSAAGQRSSWSQPASSGANPFMGTLPAASKTSSLATNPFL